MKAIYSKTLIAALPLLALTSCMDKDYDLQNIDSTVRVNVKDLTIPINLDAITLENIFDLDPDDPDAAIKVDNGKYVVSKSGSFSSSDITVSGFTIQAPHVNPVSVTVPASVSGTFPLSSPTTSFEGNSANIDENIIDVYGLTTDFYITFKSTLHGNGVSARLTDVVYDLPKGFTATSDDGVYDPVSGEFRLNGTVDANNTTRLHVTGLDARQAGVKLNHADNNISFDGHFALKSSEITVDVDAPTTASIGIDCIFENIPALTVDARFRYDIDGVSISDVTLGDLPDFLTGENTNLKIVNPQIHFSITNPLAAYRTYASSGLTITAYRGNGEEAKSFSPDPDYFATKPDRLVSNFCMSPVKASLEGYDDEIFVPFASLSDVLSGKGIPSTIGFELTDAQFPEQDIYGLPLGDNGNIGAAEGHYTLYAPLEFGAGSMVVYSDKMDGWGDDVEKMVIEHLSITAIADSNVPINMNFTAYPIDKEGNRIGDVEIEGAELPANASAHPLNIRITGEIRDIDGIRFVATATPGTQNNVLSPDMTINLSTIRPVVSGYYQDEF